MDVGLGEGLGRYCEGKKDHPPDGGETDEKKTYGFGWIGPWSKIASAYRPWRPSF
jgi:hypothetical protein